MNIRLSHIWAVFLKECKDNNQLVPRFLLMENVSAIHGPLHKKNFELWKNELENLGYTNRYYDLDIKYLEKLGRELRSEFNKDNLIYK